MSYGGFISGMGNEGIQNSLWVTKGWEWNWIIRYTHQFILVKVNTMKGGKPRHNVKEESRPAGWPLDDLEQGGGKEDIPNVVKYSFLDIFVQSKTPKIQFGMNWVFHIQQIMIYFSNNNITFFLSGCLSSSSSCFYLVVGLLCHLHVLQHGGKLVIPAGRFLHEVAFKLSDLLLSLLQSFSENLSHFPPFGETPTIVRKK